MEFTGKLEIQEGGLLPSTIVHWKLLMVNCSGEESRSVPLDPQGLSPEKWFSSKKGQCPHPTPNTLQGRGLCPGRGNRNHSRIHYLSPLDFQTDSSWRSSFHSELDYRPRVQGSRESYPLIFIYNYNSFLTSAISSFLNWWRSWNWSPGNYPAQVFHSGEDAQRRSWLVQSFTGY